MARRKTLERYPNRYWDLIQKAWKEPVFIPCEDAYRARSIRNDLYNFRMALKEASEENDRLSIFSKKAEDLIFSVLSPNEENSGPRLVISRKNPVNEIPPEQVYQDA